MTELFIIRHGQTLANVQGIKQGNIDDARTNLTTTGKEQAAQLARHLNPGNNFTVMYVSPLHRARQTAQILNRRLQLPVITDSRLREISYGDWDGLKTTDLMKKYPALFYPGVNKVRPTYAKVAGGETFDQVEQRVLAFAKDISHHYPNGRVVVVTHGFTTRSFATAITGTKGMEILSPDNCSVSKVLVEPTTQTMHLCYYNRVVDSRF